jgi:hypothetical protein
MSKIDLRDEQLNAIIHRQKVLTKEIRRQLAREHPSHLAGMLDHCAQIIRRANEISNLEYKKQMIISTPVKKLTFPRGAKARSISLLSKFITSIKQKYYHATANRAADQRFSEISG